LNENFRKHRVPPPQEEGREAYRALKTAPLVFAAIYLRDGDAKGAIDAIDAAQARELVRPELMHALEGAADKADATHWLAVVNALHPARDDEHEASSDDSDDEEIMGDRDVLRVATLGAALEAYRLDPSVPEAAGTIAASLEVMGMAEASPAVLFDAVKAHPEAKIVSGALAITMHAMAGELAADDVEAARRVYRAALPLIAIADDAKLAGKLSPSSSRVQAMMGEIELREGRLPEAHALLEAALKKEKSGAVLLALARIDRYEQRVAAALEDLREALAQKDTVSEPALRGEVLLLTSDITREQGDGAAARTPLIEALHELEKARTGAEGDNRARIERTLARVLDRFGADKRAEKVLEHALDAAPRNKSEAAATIGDLVARSFVHGDLKAARDGLQRGLAADLDNDDLVYYALWVRLLERQLRVTTDGVADRIFASALEGPRWPGRLAAFGAGLIKSNELIAAARTPSQKTEALFYAAMDKRAAGDVKGSNDQLRQVMSAGGVDQMEVAIARDLLSGVPRVPGPLPAEIAQP
jgi:tetratricopeptide (TPR) repeat protein